MRKSLIHVVLSFPVALSILILGDYLVLTELSLGSRPSPSPTYKPLPKVKPPNPPPRNLSSTIPGKTQNNCPAPPRDLPQFTGLLAEVHTKPVMMGGVTLSKKPTIWIYHPFSYSQLSSQPSNANSPAQITPPLPENTPVSLLAVLLSSNPKTIIIERRNLRVLKSQTPGVIGIQLDLEANSAIGAQSGNEYLWEFQINCDDQPLRVIGWLRYLDNPELRKRIAQERNPLEQVRIYLESGYWYDAVDTLARLRLKNPNDPSLKKAWLELLADVRLEKLADKPIVGEFITNPPL